MISIPSALYDPIKHRYRGVYRSGAKWRAIVQPKDSQDKVYLGTFPSQEEAARAVVEFYVKEYGERWLDVVMTRHGPFQHYKIRRIVYTRYFVPTVVWVAETCIDRKWLRISPEHVGMDTDWNEEYKGWATKDIAQIALRLYRSLNRPSPIPPQSPTPAE